MADGPRELPAQIITRLPVRYTFEDGYFNDRFQGQPVDGYTAIFEKMLAHELIETRLGMDFFDIKPMLRKDLPVAYTGPIDRYFDYSEGELGWRTIDIDLEVMDTPDHQGTAIMNYADEAVPFTRVVEFRHFNPERQHGSGKTLIGREYSRFAGRADEPYYPIDTRKDQAIYRRYFDRAGAEKNLHLGDGWGPTAISTCTRRSGPPSRPSKPCSSPISSAGSILLRGRHNGPGLKPRISCYQAVAADLPPVAICCLNHSKVRRIPS
ncbi:UDP-galactopyranose mutase [Mesorhizobium sp. M8A.F.Ca.ET.057.01.1.1]|uniref:UDP-galactopyranose mutase n=1 Tax=Mesorhizobium sp. M8A.F.Ca.ET.057.01.1.1 TaxID=2493679 RepID=UPI001FE00C2B|nr:UDP-galactopyranose mutase [Mesorhizobium sp. M8A.F.Ca.ET.057.01.1.1]